jgi:hypothetical protein
MASCEVAAFALGAVHFSVLVEDGLVLYVVVIREEKTDKSAEQQQNDQRFHNITPFPDLVPPSGGMQAGPFVPEGFCLWYHFTRKTEKSCQLGGYI